eukprot:TRINITY_DN37_c0_g4_i1.p1 TRINITY_DN37_c0_g4~~TRINITY_DN37_c0_g4_i1.p1  ORF type:complete len:184 (-),score=102.78 TRINITY_DN37_c0_g4_i1:79-630(-)
MASNTSEERKQIIINSLRNVPNFPKEGIQFKDVSTLVLNPNAFRATIDELKHVLNTFEYDLIAGLESRGFIFGCPVATDLHKGFIMMRKPSKLPCEKYSVSYGLEYGKDAIEMHTDAIRPGQKVVVIDDLIATGGTAGAACSLVEKAGGIVTAIVFVIELDSLGGRQKLESQGRTVLSLVHFD